MLAGRQSIRMDPSDVSTELARIAPSYEWDGKSWDSLSLLAAALLLSPDIAQAKATLAAVQAQEKTAAQAPGPTLVLASEYALNTTELSPWLFGVAVDFPIDTGARRDARINSAALSTDIALFDFMDAAWSARQSIHRALADTLVARQEKGVAAEIVVLTENQLQAMEHRRAAGAANSFEVQRVRADLDLNRRLLLETEAREHMAIERLASTLGVSSAALDADGLQWHGLDNAMPLSEPVSPVCRQEALLARPDIARATANYDLAEEGLRSAVAAQYPALHIAPGYTWERGLKKLPLGISMSLPPLDLNRAAIEAAEAKRAEAGSQLESVVFAAAAAIDQAELQYRASLASFDTAHRQSEIQADLLAKADVAIQSGATSRVDWRISQLALLNAKLVEFAALRDLRLAQTNLEDALRRPLFGPELAITTEPSTTGETACVPFLSAQS